MTKIEIGIEIEFHGVVVEVGVDLRFLFYLALPVGGALVVMGLQMQCLCLSLTLDVIVTPMVDHIQGLWSNYL